MPEESKEAQEQRQVARMKPQATANPTSAYKPNGSGMGWSWGLAALDGKPFYTWWDIPRMKRDPRVRFLEKMWRSPFQRAKFTVRATHPVVKQYVERAFTKFWKESMPALLHRYFWYGFAPGGAEFSRKRGFLKLDTVRPVEPFDAKPLQIVGGRSDGQLCGFTFGATNVLLPHAYWFAGNKELGSFYDMPPASGMFEPWAEKRERNGAVDMRRLWFRKNASRGVVIRHPGGRTEATDEFPGGRDNQSLARQVADYAETNSVITLTNDINPADPSKYAWEVEWPESFPDRAGFRDYPKDLDAEMAEGVGIPREVLEAASVGSGYSGREVPLMAWLGGADEFVGLLVRSCEWLRWVVMMNFGPNAAYEIDPQSLVDQLRNESKGPGGMGGAVANMVNPPNDDGGGAAQPGKPSSTGWTPVKGPRGGEWEEGADGRRRHARYLSDGRFGEIMDGRIRLSRAVIKAIRRCEKIRELSDGRTVDKKARRKELLILLAMLDFQKRAHAINDPESAQPYLEALKQYLKNPDALRYPLELSWRADETATGHIKAVGEAEHAGRVLYGARAEAALRNQESLKSGLKPGERAAKAPVPHPNRDQWMKAGQRAQQILANVAGKSHTPGELDELATHLQYLPMDRLMTARSILRAQFRGVRGRLDQVEKLKDHIREQIGVMNLKPTEETKVAHAAGEIPTANPLDHLADIHGDPEKLNELAKGPGYLGVHDAINAAYRGEMGDDVKAAVEKGGHWNNHGGAIGKRLHSIGKELHELRQKKAQTPGSPADEPNSPRTTEKSPPAESEDAKKNIYDAFRFHLKDDVHPVVKQRFHDAAKQAIAADKEIAALTREKDSLKYQSPEWYQALDRLQAAERRRSDAGKVDLRVPEATSEQARPATEAEWHAEVKKIKAAHAQNVWNEVQKRLDNGETVQFNTMTKRFPISPKNRSALRITPGGDIQVARGKHWDSLAGQGLDTLAHNLGIKKPELPALPQKPDEGPGKPSHEMTQAEYLEAAQAEPHEADAFKTIHRSHVERALAGGEHVPPEVLAGYPDLKEPQDHIDPEKVAKMQETKSGLPPMDVVKDGEGLHHVEDGHHRGAAAHANGDETVPARVWEKGEDGFKLAGGVKAEPAVEPAPMSTFPHKPLSAEVTTFEKNGKKQKGITWPFRAQTAKDIAEGNITADELRRRFEEFAADPAAVKSHLADVLKKSGLRSPEKIKEQAQFMFDRAAATFSPAESYTYSMEDFRTPGAMDRKKIEATRSALSKLTDEDLKSRAAGYAEKKAKFDKAMNNPETKDEFEHFIDRKGEAALSPEQRAKWDDLQASSRRDREQASREAKAVVPGFAPGEAVTGDIGIVEGHHQKRNAPTFTVTVQNRLGEDKFSEALQRAKRMGGSYVNAMIAKRYGATSGFQFFNKADAESFAANLRGENVDRTEQVKQEQADAAANRADSLVNRGASLEDAAQADLGRDRLTNTARRAEQAASAESAARSKIATGRTLSSIGEKMAAGDLKHLNKVRSAQDVDTLDSVLKRARYDRFHKAQKAEPDKRMRWEEFAAEPHSEDDVSAVEYPYPKMWASDLRSAASDLKDEPGLMRLAQKLAKAGDTSPKFKTQGNGFKFNGGQVLSRDAVRSMVPGLTIPEDKALRLHTSYDWRLAQQGKGPGPFYTANGGKTFGTSPAAAVANALAGEHQKHVDLVDPAEDKLLTIDNPHEIDTLKSIASRLRNRSDSKLKRIGESLSDRLEHYNRLQRADIKSPAELRAALREYLPLKQSADKEDPVKKMERGLIGKKIPGFFPTPRAAIDDMLDRADIQPGMTVLEPSAGKGDILDAIREREPEAKAKGIEFNSELAGLLKAKGHDISHGNFLDEQGDGERPDRIVMNPPFEDGQDAEHVRHAYDLLKPGGKLVAIMSNGPFFRESRKDAAFREWLDSVHGEHEEMPEGSFAGDDAFRKTGVRTRMVTIQKPGA